MAIAGHSAANRTRIGSVPPRRRRAVSPLAVSSRPPRAAQERVDRDHADERQIGEGGWRNSSAPTTGMSGQTASATGCSSGMYDWAAVRRHRAARSCEAERQQVARPRHRARYQRWSRPRRSVEQRPPRHAANNPPTMRPTGITDNAAERARSIMPSSPTANVPGARSGCRPLRPSDRRRDADRGAEEVDHEGGVHHTLCTRARRRRTKMRLRP